MNGDQGLSKSPRQLPELMNPWKTFNLEKLPSRFRITLHDLHIDIDLIPPFLACIPWMCKVASVSTVHLPATHTITWR